MPTIKYLTPTINQNVLEMYSVSPLPKPLVKKAIILGKKIENKSRVKTKLNKLLLKVKYLCRPRTITFKQGTSRKTMSFDISSTEYSNGIWYAYGTLDSKKVTLLVDPNQTHCEVIYL